MSKKRERKGGIEKEIRESEREEGREKEERKASHVGKTKKRLGGWEREREIRKRNKRRKSK